ncbi:MAG: hypothetical protein FJY85_15115 [Deltaproteobacteria bacterium]|nr:hypothetical protein [Deltaproteobacteria bacterium]
MIQDVDRVQSFTDNLTRKKLHRKFNGLARRINPLMGDLPEWAQYCWVIDQYEFSTDIMFKDRNSLEGLLPSLLKHATVCFSAEDVMTFLGRKLQHTFTEVAAGTKFRYCKIVGMPSRSGERHEC